MSGVPNDVRDKTYRLCREFLGGPWKTLSIDDFHIEHISGGLSNLLYMCAIKPEKRQPAPEGSKDDVPHTVMIRIYGKIIQENPETVVTDSVIFALLAERGMGPKLYGVFTEGRVEEYIPSRHLYTHELAEPGISAECARKMAMFHQLNMPLIKQPTWLFQQMDRYMEGTLSFLQQDHEDVERQKLVQQLLAYNLKQEMQNLKHILGQVDSPVVLCHNDLQEGNILLMGKEQNCSLMPIDFEYASYNYRGFDFGNHFCEWCYNYSVNEPPYYAADLAAYPSRDQQLRFFRAYLSECGYPSGKEQEEEEAREEVLENMLLEAAAFALASHFYWGLWSVVQAKMSDIQFDYMRYALVRFEHYFQQKGTLPAKLQVNGINGAS